MTHGSQMETLSFSLSLSLGSCKLNQPVVMIMALTALEHVCAPSFWKSDCLAVGTQRCCAPMAHSQAERCPARSEEDSGFSVTLNFQRVCRAAWNHYSFPP